MTRGWVRRVMLVSLLLAVTASGSALLAHQPSVLDARLVMSVNAGLMQDGPQFLGDDQVLIRLAPREEFLDDWLLVVFPSMSIDKPISGRPVLNLEEVLEQGASPVYEENWSDPGPAWRMYAMAPKLSDADVQFLHCDLREIVIRAGRRMQSAFLFAPGEPINFVAIVDLLRSDDGAVRPQMLGHIYTVDPRMVDQMDGKPEQIAALVKNRRPDADVEVGMQYRIIGDQWLAGSFEDVFGAPPIDPMEGPETASYARHAANLPVLVNDFKRYRPMPGNTSEPGRKLFLRTLERIMQERSAQAGEEFCNREDYLLQEPGDGLDGEQDGVSHYLSGRFSTKWASDSTLHPGFAWRAEAWTNENETWQLLASDWVQWDGRWSLQIADALGYEGRHLRMVYRAYNGYFQPQDRNGNRYSFRDPDQYGIGTFYNAGHRYADTDGGAANGLGDLYDAGAEMWSKLYWAAGVNPIRDEPIKLWYPNTWFDCGTGGAPWSCANSAGNVWLIPEHGTKAEVVAHELAHQLNYEYWDNKRPANSGGPHSLHYCYPTRTGMTLFEGFANFIPAWVGYQNRHVAEGGFNDAQWQLAYAPETRFAPPDCAEGWENEVWVARTFWDLHDTRSDGDDILWFHHKGAVISIYLDNGVANDGDWRDMRFYEDVYRAAASAGHEDFISDIFDQNRQ